MVQKKQAEDNGVKIKKGVAVYKVQTLVDGGFRMTFDVAETEIIQVAQVMQYQIDGVSFGMELKPDSR